MYKIRIILDTKEDVIRTLLVDEKQCLEPLHYTIAKAFNFDGQEMASFYRTDNECMSETGEGISMGCCYLNETLPNVNDKLIYVYDFLQMWTFYVEVIEQSNETISESKIILSIGEIPKEAPEKEFKAEKTNDDIEDNFNDFDSLDDFDFDNY